MTQANRSVEMALRIKTEGAESIAELGRDVRDLAGEGAGLESALTGGAASLTKLAAATKQFRTEEAAARGDLKETQSELQQKRDELERLRIKYRAVGGEAAAFRLEEGRLKEEILNARTALRQKRETLDTAAIASKNAAAAERNLATEIERSGKATVKATADTRAGLEGVNRAGLDATGALRQLGPLIASAFSAQAFVQTITSAESLSRSFEQIFGSAARAREELDFIRSTADRLGLENLELARSYQSLSAATKGTTLEGEATRQVFEAVSRAMSTLGKGSADTNRALTAIAQIASKGTASMEELRGQLGEALPGALQAAADGAGLTVAQLVEMVSSGQVLSGDILPALTKGLNNLYAKAAPPQTIISEWARFKNVLADTAIALGEGGASKGIAKALSGAALAVQGASAEVDILGTSLGEMVGALVTGNFELGTGEELAARYAEQLRKSAEAAGLAEKSQTELSAAQAQGAQTAAEGFRASELLAANQQSVGESMLKTKALYADLAKGAHEYTEQVNKELVARTSEAAALVQFANLAGSEVEKRQAAVGAAEAHLAASQRLARAREVEAIIAQSLSIKLQEEASHRNDTTEATRKEIEKAQQSAAAKNTEAQSAAAVAAAKRIEAEAARVNAQAYEDNTARLHEYRAAASEAAREVERLVALQQQGKATDDEVAEARTKAAGATRLYRDALSDAADAAERRVNTERQLAQAAQACISVDLERVKAAHEVALANDDAAKAASLQRQETMLQVQAAQLQADAARREAQAIREVTSQREAELRALGELTAAKRDELDAARRSADLKDLEAEKADILAQKTRDLANSEATRTAGLEQQIAAQEKALDLAQRQQALEERKRTSYNTAGEAVNMGGQTLMSLIETLKGYGLDDKKAQEIARQFTDSKGEVPYFDNPGQKKYGADTLSMALQKAASQALYGNGAPVAGSQQPAAGSASRTVNIKLNGRSSAINVASQQDSDALVGVLRQLENGKATAA